MGRGLSALQQQILVLAWEKEQASDGDARAPLYPHEILLRRTDWPLTVHGRVWVDHGWCAQERGKYFARSQIDPRAYNATRVALWRSLGRLQTRGLITHTWAEQGGLRLTDQGRQTAHQLSVIHCGQHECITVRQP
jgi:hypothetical protein